MGRILTVLFCLIFSVNGFAQNGDYFLSHFVPPGVSGDHQVYDLVQDENGIFYMAHKSGIFIFDGSKWEDVRAGTSIFTLAYRSGTVYAGGPDGFSRFVRNDDFEWEFQPMHEGGLVRDILRLTVIDSSLYGMSSAMVYKMDLASGKALAMAAPGSSDFVHMFEYNGKLHVLDAAGKTYIPSGEQLRTTHEGIASKGLLFVSRLPGTSQYLAADMDDELYIYDGDFIRLLDDAVDSRDRDYLKESGITSGLWVNDSLVAVSTLKGGVVFMDPETGGKEARNVQKIVNYQNDLPDNEVYSLFLDNAGAVWVGHEKGFTRVAPGYPFRRYDRFPGLQGKILNAYRHKGDLYVGTSQGLFLLKETPVYEEVSLKFTEWVTVDAERKGLLNRLFGRKSEATRERREVVRTKKEFHSINYEFVRISDIPSKVFHLAVANGKLYSSGLDGIFEIQGDRVRRLTSVPVRYFHYSNTRGKLFAATYEGNIISLDPAIRKPEAQELFTDILEPINYIFERRNGDLLLSGMHTVFLADARDNLMEIPFENPFFEETYGVEQDDQVYLINESGVYTIDFEKLTTSLVETSEKPGKLILGVNDQVWVLSSAGWNPVGKQTEMNAFPHLQVLDGIRFISESSSTNALWVIADNGAYENALFRLTPQQAPDWFSRNDLFLSEIVLSDQRMSPHEKIRFDQENSNVVFDFRQPDYSGVKDTEFMYELRGEKEERSEWSSENNQVRFSYLPAGTYFLKVRSRNALGMVSESPEVTFHVMAPYWKRTWFYALEFAIIALMLLISIRMKAMGYKYRLISRLLALLTLITIIELIQALAESKFETEASPVFGFIIQVLMAVMILPVEEILRKYIFKEKDVKVFDIFTIREKKNKPVLSEQSAVAGSGDEL